MSYGRTFVRLPFVYRHSILSFHDVSSYASWVLIQPALVIVISSIHWQWKVMSHLRVDGFFLTKRATLEPLGCSIIVVQSLWLY